MRKIVLILCGVLATAMANGQVVTDNFKVGPYDVDYLGKGDVNVRLDTRVNLYEYYGLKKDTIIIESPKDSPIKKAFEMGISCSTPRFGIRGAFNSLGLYGTAKSKISSNLYLNYGGTIAISYGNYNETLNCLKDVLLEVGIPLSIEFANLNRSKSSLYANIGINPMYYTTTSATETNNGEEIDAEKKNGLYFAPKLEVGGYIPVNEHLIKIGVFGEYRICCSKEEDNIFKQRIGRAFIGARLGYIF